MELRTVLSFLTLCFQLLFFVKTNAQVTQTFSFTGTIQTFTVPCVTQLTIQAKGAEGGAGPQPVLLNLGPLIAPGLGASIRGVITVTPGQVLKILVGEQPNLSNGGGGGSFVTDINNTPLVIAGGGGGCASTADSVSKHGRAGTAGATGGGITSGIGGTNGNGGDDGTFVFGAIINSNLLNIIPGAGGGGGLLTNGQTIVASGTGGRAFVNGGAGGNGSLIGGFGGGGGGCGYTPMFGAPLPWSQLSGGGGGGYSGGGGGGNRASGEVYPNIGGGVGGGGGSYNAGTNQVNLAGVNSGHGQVTIAYCLTCNAPPTLTLTATGSSCTAANGATAFATGGLSPYTYTWTGTAQTTSVVTGLPTGGYTVTVGAPAGCQTKTAAVNVTASSSIAVTNTALCIGYSTTMTAVTPLNSYSWTPTLNILSATNSPTVIANPTTTTIYTVSGTNSVNCVSTNTLQLFVASTQTVPILTPTSCVGSALQLTANTTYTGATYQWSGPGGYNSLLQNPARSPATLAMSGPYSITVVSAPGCTSSAVTNVTVFPVPTTQSITSNAPICSGFVLNLNGSGGTSYFWQGPNTFTSNLQNVAITNATNTLHSGIYTLTAKFATGCAAMFTKSITVRALPVPTITSNNPVCLGKNLNLSGTGGALYSWTGPNGFTSGIQNPTVSGVAFASAGNYSLTTTDLFGCQGSTSQSVTILGNPTITAVSGSTVCYGYQGTLSSTLSGAPTYTWNGPGSYSSTVQNPTVPIVNTIYTGIYTLTAGGAVGGCTSQATAALNTIPLPAVTATGALVCDGQPATLYANGAGSYTWSGPGAYASTMQNPTINPATNLTVGNYTVAGVAVNGCTAAVATTLQIKALPVINPVGAAVCSGASATLMAGGGAGYYWTGPGTYTSALQNASIAAVTNTLADTYTVLVTGVNGCTASATTTLMAKTNPTIYYTTNTTVCLLQPAVLSASSTPNNVTFNWTGPGNYSSSTPTAGIASATSPLMQTYSVVGTAPNSCTALATATLNTYPLPTITATGTMICLNEPFTLAANGATSYVWAGPGINGSIVSSTVAFAAITPTNTGNYLVIGTGAYSCSNSATASLSTMPLPTIMVSPPNPTVCYGQPASLKASGGLLSGYTWKGPSNYVSNLAIISLAAINATTAGVYTVVGTAANSCTNSATDTLSFYNLPVPQFIAPARVCFGSSIQLYGSGANTYTWTGPYNYVSAAPNVTIPIYNMLQEGTYTLNVIDIRGCFNSTTTPLQIDPLPNGILVTDNSNNNCVPYCANFALKTNDDDLPITNISWQLADRTFTGMGFNYCVNKAGPTSIIGTLTNALGCTNKVSYNITGYPNPQADFNYLPFKPVESVDLVEFTNTSQGEKVNRWNWYFINNRGYQSSDENPGYLFENAGTYAVAMVATNDWGCMDTVVKTVVVDADFNLYIPNTFTPNGDGVNDIFQPKGRGIQNYNLSIYDRWGNLVYHTTDFEKGWDGTDNGKQTTDDMYAWRIYSTDVSGKNREMTGSVTLVR